MDHVIPKHVSSQISERCLRCYSEQQWYGENFLFDYIGDSDVDGYKILEIGCAEAGLMKFYQGKGAVCSGLELSDGVSKFAGGRILLGTSTEGHADADDLTLESASGYTGITLRAGTTNGGAIYFSDATSGAGEYVGQILYSHNSDKMFLVAGGQTGLEVHSDRNVEITDGNLVIGTSGHGIDFSATSDGNGTDSSELLDDYEEGSFTPSGFCDGGSVSVSWKTFVLFTSVGGFPKLS